MVTAVLKAEGDLAQGMARGGKGCRATGMDKGQHGRARAKDEEKRKGSAAD